MKRRAVVTGYGVVTTIGNAVAEFWSSLINGRRVPINSLTRYMLGTSGIVEIISTILSIQHGIIPWVLNSENSDQVVVLSIIRDENLKRCIEVVMSNSFGFGGQNASL